MNAAVLRRQDFGHLSREPAFAGVLVAAFIAGAVASVLAGVPGTQMDVQSRTAYTPSAERFKSSPQISYTDPNELSDSVSLRIVVQKPQTMPAAEEPSLTRLEPAPAVAAPVQTAAPLSEKKALKPAAAQLAAVPEPVTRAPEPSASAAPEKAPASLVAAPMTASIFNLQLKPPPLSEIDDDTAKTSAMDAAAAASPLDTSNEKENASPDAPPQSGSAKNGESSGLRKYLFDRMFGFMRIGPD